MAVVVRVASQPWMLFCRALYRGLRDFIEEERTPEWVPVSRAESKLSDLAL